MLNPWLKLTVLAAQSQRAFMLNMMQMSLGGRVAQREAAPIVLEKPRAPATARAATAVKRGGPSERTAKGSRQKEKAQIRRRSRTK